MKVFGVVITSSPGCTPTARNARCNALVPLFTATQCLTSQYAANSSSNLATSSPRMNDAFRQTRSRAARISSRRMAYCAFRSKYGTSMLALPAETRTHPISARAIQEDRFEVTEVVADPPDVMEDPGRGPSRGVISRGRSRPARDGLLAPTKGDEAARLLLELVRFAL